MLIIVSGFAGSGKSSLADSLGKQLGLPVVHASALLREMSIFGIKALRGAPPEKIKDWWESDEAKELMEKRKEDTSLDIALDKKLREVANSGNVVLDSWTMGYLYDGGYKIWLNASAEVRAKRVAQRDALEYKEVLEKIRARDFETKSLYERLYNFSMGKNLERFDLVIDTDKLLQKEVFGKALAKIKDVKANGKGKNRN
ncbi:MAG: cytidylate kinase family protein [archaeon]|nr:cytidylate kinase family protein [archaeon]